LLIESGVKKNWIAASKLRHPTNITLTVRCWFSHLVHEMLKHETLVTVSSIELLELVENNNNNQHNCYYLLSICYFILRTNVKVHVCLKLLMPAFLKVYFTPKN
jgi:hypothetical protein